MKKQILLISILSALGFSRASADDVTAVNWGGNYVTATQTFSDLTGFSTTIPLMNTGASYSGTSPTFYGGGHTPNTVFRYFTPTDTTGITDNGAFDEISFCWNGNTSSSAFGEVLWQKADFLNGASSASQLTFDSLSSISVSLSNTPAQTRILVEDGGTYYLSNLNFTTSTTLTDPDNNSTWAVYVPNEASNAVPFDAVNASFVSHDFSDVQAIGYYFDSENNTNSLYHYGMNGFSAQVQTAPEPSSFVLIVCFGLVLCWFWRGGARGIAVALLLPFVCAFNAHGQTYDFNYGYKTVLDSNAQEYVVSAQNVQTYNEGTPGASYWAPSTTGTVGILTSEFTFAEPTSEIFLNAQLASFNFGGGTYGYGSLWGSTDGSTWSLLLDSPTTSSAGSYVFYDQDVPSDFLGTTSFWLQERLTAFGSPIMAQFTHYGQGNSFNGFDLDANYATPEPSSFALLALSLFALANSRKVGRSRAQNLPARG